jgi:hypothetical protein
VFFPHWWLNEGSLTSVVKEILLCFAADLPSRSFFS